MKNKTIFSEICKLKDKKTFIYTEKVLRLFSRDFYLISSKLAE